MKNLFKVSSLLAIIVGIIMVVAGVWALNFTYTNVAREKITTPADASIPNTPVRGPFTLKSQADVIRYHTLEATKGRTYAEMERTDESRPMWVTATTLTTALNLGIISYAFSGLVAFLGLVMIWVGVIFRILGKN